MTDNIRKCQTLPKIVYSSKRYYHFSKTQLKSHLGNDNVLLRQIPFFKSLKLRSLIHVERIGNMLKNRFAWTLPFCPWLPIAVVNCVSSSNVIRTWKSDTFS
jgi:hypothetical protein